jgi:dolichyl-phosphate-mannose--protein O-mannosyl transferase
MGINVSHSGTERESRSVYFSRKRMWAPLALSGLSFMAGCGRAPSFNILGSFFPAWLVCMVAGIALAAVVHGILVRFKLDTEIAWTIVVYPCLAALIAFILWLVFFS